METLLHWLGYGLCHQLPQRSFFGGGMQVPVCARDTGIFVGFAIALALIALLDRGRRPTEPPSMYKSIVLVMFIAAMAWDGLTSYAGMRTTTNELRLLTGLMTGYALAAFTVPLLSGQLWRVAGRSRVLDGRGHFLVYVASMPMAWGLVFFGAPLLGVVYPLLVAASILVTFTAVNLVIVCLFPWFERKASRLGDAWLPILLALALTGFELAASSYLKYWLEMLAGLR